MTGRRELNKNHISDLRILACGFFLEGYPRYDTLWEALSGLGLQQLIDLRDKRLLDEKQVDILRAERSRSIFHKMVVKIRSLYYLPKYAISISRTARQEMIDIIFVFPGSLFLATCLGMLKFFHGGRVYFDLYTSAYSAARTHSPGMLKTAEAYILERLSSKLADRLICLTPEYASYYKKLYKIRADKFSSVPDGIQDIWLEQPASTSQDLHRPKRVLYWGNYLVQHGLDMILDSAKELEDENIEFVFCGKGDNEGWVREEARRRNLSNVVFRGFIPTTEELIQIVDSADIVLGHLKDMHDTGLSASNKMKQGMARSKPVITIWTRQKEELYQTKDNPVPPIVQIEQSSRALIAAIREVISDPHKAEQIGNIAWLTVKKLHGIEAITSALKEAVVA